MIQDILDSQGNRVDFFRYMGRERFIEMVNQIPDHVAYVACNKVTGNLSLYDRNMKSLGALDVGWEEFDDFGMGVLK